MPLPLIPIAVVGVVSSLGLFGFSSAVKSSGEAAGELTKLLVVGASAVAIAAAIKRL